MTPLFEKTFTAKEIGNIAAFLKQCRHVMGQPSRSTWDWNGSYSGITLRIYDTKYATWFALKY